MTKWQKFKMWFTHKKCPRCCVVVRRTECVYYNAEEWLGNSVCGNCSEVTHDNLQRRLERARIRDIKNKYADQKQALLELAKEDVDFANLVGKLFGEKS